MSVPIMKSRPMSELLLVHLKFIVAVGNPIPQRLIVCQKFSAFVFQVEVGHLVPVRSTTALPTNRSPKKLSLAQIKWNEFLYGVL